MNRHGGAILWPSELRTVLGLVKRVCLMVYGALTRIKVFGVESWERIRGGCIVVANHVTGADAIILQIALKRRLFMLAARRWFEGSKFIAYFLTFFCEMIPIAVEEGPGNFLGIKRTLQLLRSNQSVGIFPAGHLSRDGSMPEIHKGAAYLAVKSGKPIVTVYLGNLTCGPKPGRRAWIDEAVEGFGSVVHNIGNRKIKAYIASPIYPRSDINRKKEVERLSAEIRKRFDALREKANRLVMP